MKKLLLLSLVILLSGCNKDDIDSLNQQIASLTKKIADDAAVSDQKLAVAILGFDTSLNTLKDELNISISSLTAFQTSLTNSQTLISNNIENIDDQILSLDASMTAIFAIVDELKNADNVLSSNISEIQVSI